MRYTDSFTIRDEANAITAYAFRNGFLEELHAGKESPLLADPTLSRISDTEMKKLMIDASTRVEALLTIRDENPESYRATMKGILANWCHGWER